MLTVQKFVTQEREKAGLSVTDLAKISGVDRSLISKIESGKGGLTTDKAKALFNALFKAQKTTSGNKG